MHALVILVCDSVNIFAEFQIDVESKTNNYELTFLLQFGSITTKNQGDVYDDGVAFIDDKFHDGLWMLNFQFAISMFPSFKTEHC